MVAVRAEPEKGAKEIGERFKDETVEVMEMKGDWLRLQPPPNFTSKTEHWMLSSVGGAPDPKSPGDTSIAKDFGWAQGILSGVG